MALTWNDKHNIGEDKVDAEHKEWFRMANVFLDASSRQSRNVAGEAFSRYTRQHFFAEETMMGEVHYPLTATHVIDHDRLLSTLGKIFDVDIEEALSKVELEEFVGFTLTKHITSFDAPLSVFVKRNCCKALVA